MNNLNLAKQLWGEQAVTKYICANGKVNQEEIIDRLNAEIHNDKLFYIQYWPIFDLDTQELIGCCGLCPFKIEINSYEVVVHLHKKYWGMGYAFEATKAVY